MIGIDSKVKVLLPGEYQNKSGIVINAGKDNKFLVVKFPNGKTASFHQSDLKLKESVIKESKKYSFKEISTLDNYSNSCGFTEIKIKQNQLTITHNGNMGNSIERSVDPNLKICGFPTIKELKKHFQLIKEEGDPDYSYNIIFNLTKLKENKITIKNIIQEELMKVLNEGYAGRFYADSKFIKPYVDFLVSKGVDAKMNMDGMYGRLMINMKDIQKSYDLLKAQYGNNAPVTTSTKDLLIHKESNQK